MLLLVGTAVAESKGSIPASDYARINMALVEGHILPRYVRLARQTESLALAAVESCTDHQPIQQLPRLRAAFRDAMRAFVSIQHIHFGPIEYFSRHQRFHFWPQARHKVKGAIEAALPLDDEALSPDQFARTSAAVQGFPAIEQLIFDEDFLIHPQGCRLLGAVTDNLQRMAAETLIHWTEGDPPFVLSMVGSGVGDGWFRNHQDVTLALFTSLHNGLQFIVDVRLKPVVGESLQDVRPTLAESRLSGQSARHVTVGLAALQALYLGEGGPGLGDLAAQVDPALDQVLRKAFRVTLETANSIHRPLEITALNPTLRPNVTRLVL